MPLFKKLINRPRRIRGDAMDAQETWQAVLKQHDEILNDYKAASEEDKVAARA